MTRDTATPQKLAVASVAIAPLAPNRGTTKAVSRAESGSCAAVRVVSSTADQRSGVTVRAIMPMVIHSISPSGMPAKARTAIRPGPCSSMVPASAQPSARDAPMPQSLSRVGLIKAPAKPVEAAMHRASMAAVMPIPDSLSRCSVAMAPSRIASTPAGSREITPRAITAVACAPPSGGPKASWTRWSLGGVSAEGGESMLRP
jgi:hypothetical protein